ncbi:hypothetical protein Xmau_00484 [Xenorhabdus mauleonii]|uniref:Uncharacterized protein n=1 Tax=Xenorhabdus mauleonii TaxID=351675 RepID=A0A1I3J4G2_9GAMM|nr:hypothetical protein [Xenorhabdus mauleonii]PHM46088.1 hypothetical protein Xmau_00484 [Xenorhabdus mauleonii]SFI54996.1 hypothetical protein SAMN05421680_10279 [Xenorhabdus mauleonii]
MSEKNKNLLTAPKLPQGELDGVINISDIKAMGVHYIIMQVSKYKESKLLDRIEGEIYLKGNENTKVKSIAYYITIDKLDQDFYFLLFHVGDINIFGLCEAKYSVTDLNKNNLYSKVSDITIIGGSTMSNLDNEVIFLDAKKSIVYLSEIERDEGIKVRAKFKGLIPFDTIDIIIKILNEYNFELSELSSGDIVLTYDDISKGYKDVKIETNKVNFSEAKFAVASFSAVNEKITSSYTEVSIIDDIDTVNIKVQTTKNIGSSLSGYPDTKPFLTAVIYTASNSTPIKAQLTNALFDNGSSSIVMDDISTNGVGYLRIYSNDITKNSVLNLNYEDPVIAYKVPLDFSDWMVSEGEELTYTYSSYGVADGICQCFLLIKLLSDKITDVKVSFDSPCIKINGKSNVLEIINPDSSKILAYELTSNKAVRSNFTINVGGISMGQIRNTIVFVDPLTL